ncbi:MAG TPA: NAD(P)(+) transhydrogenase (Re/Si-specific) subunit beta [Smithellaceae bacterium]|nr:NAD(P)(+) transhydrogenase (Re/Si-specific) subunit beta [Smithellaceae bacterium]
MNYINTAYLVASALFIIGLRDLSHPRTAMRGNILGATGMLIAVLVTLFAGRIIGYAAILPGIVIGTVIGIIMAQKIPMTAIPQLVALFNGFGGGASVLVAGAAFAEAVVLQAQITKQLAIATAISGLIGAVTFWGSLLAFAKLQGITTEKAVRFPGQSLVNIILGVIILLIGALIVIYPDELWIYWILVALSSILGIMLVLPIGGADMPVIIALLNSYSGLAAAATGFVLSNNILIVSGALVGASGLILTKIMCKAMNRSFANCIFGQQNAAATETKVDDIYTGRVKSSTAEEVAIMLDTARRVVITPGYGMAVAHAQHAVKVLATLLQSRGVEVEFGIHPVAGRMPGHMNVLLAEAEIPYEKLKTMDEINPTFEQTDVVLVIGANDVVNPVARTEPRSPLAGMPILNVDKARSVVVIKRSLSPGFAGIPNPLFAAGNTVMLYGDGRQVVLDLVAAIGEL